MNTMISTDAVVIAAGVLKDHDLPCSAASGCKSLIPVNGRPAAAYLVDSLKRCELISRVILVCDDETFFAVPGADVHVRAIDDSTESILAGIRAAKGSDRCLIMTGDMPLATCEALEDLLTCAPDVDVVYPIVSKVDIDEYFPGRKPFYVNTKEGHFTGSSCLLFKPEVAFAKEELITRLLNARKDPKSLLSLVGPGMALKFMFSTLALRDFEDNLSRALSLKARVFVSHFPEMLMSIDSVDDIHLMERELAG